MEKVSAVVQAGAGNTTHPSPVFSSYKPNQVLTNSSVIPLVPCLLLGVLNYSEGAYVGCSYKRQIAVFEGQKPSCGVGVVPSTVGPW